MWWGIPPCGVIIILQQVSPYFVLAADGMGSVEGTHCTTTGERSLEADRGNGMYMRK